MKANELMIGDWVQGNPCGQHCDRNNNTYYKIAVLDIGNHCWGYSVCGAIVELKYDNILPIPLTPEILEKNGWRKDTYSNESRDNEEIDTLSLWGGEDKKEDWWWHVGFELVTPIKYVHEFQHALRLCGIDKTIEL